LDATYGLIQHNNPYRLEEKYGIAKKLSSNKNGESPELLYESDLHTEADAVASKIAGEIKSGQNPGQIAILTRKNKQLDTIASALQRQGVPYRLNTSQKLFQQSEIQLLLCFLQFMADPHDSTALFNLLEHPIFKLETLELARLSSKSRSINEPLDSFLRENSSLNQPFDKKLAALLAEMDRLRAFGAKHSTAELAYEFLSSSGYIANLEDAADTDPRVAGQFKNLEQFILRLVEFQEVAEDPTVRGYVRSLGNIKELWQADSYQESDYSTGEVKLMTIHQAKGLEFESVYIFDLNHTDFPGANRQNGLKIPDQLIQNEILPEGDWHLQEERRLMYVALTRAKTRLVLSFSPDHGTKQLRKPSIFLQEVFGKQIGPNSQVARQLAMPLQRFAPVEKPKTQLQDQLLDDLGRLRLTPHHIDDYLTCPYNFRYRYLLHVPEAANPALMYGNVIHQIINNYFLRRARGEVQLSELTSMIDELWSSDGFDSKKQEQQRRQQAHEAVERFYQSQETQKLLPKFTEEKLEFELPAAKALIRGRFDAVFEYPDGSVEIRDYKTSFVDSADKAEDKAKKSVQLAIYALAWKYRTGKAPDRVALDYVNTGKTGVATKTAKQLELIEQKIIKASEGIRAGEFPPQGDHRYCSHRPIGSDEKAAQYA
jgi:DNA helicase-2/ATP-dependent DNA helicase PcrA